MAEKNYHSRLLHISRQMDDVIEKLKSSFIDLKLKPAWILWLLGAPLRDLAKIRNLQNVIQTLITTKMTIILPILAAICGPWVLSNTDWPSWSVRLISGVIGYLICILTYLPRVTSFKSEHFHLGAYKTLRAQEYELLKGAFLDAEGEFYFKGLYDYVTSSKEGYRLIQELIQDYLGIERKEYLTRIAVLEQKIDEINANGERITNEYNEFTQSLIAENEQIMKEFEYVITLIKDLNTLLFRVHNKGLALRDLNLLTGFTLYELKEGKLIQIEDVGTSGITPLEIDLDEKKYENYGVVKVVKENLNQPYYNHPYPGHIIVSFKMNIDHKKVWVYNFHFDDSNTKAWKLLIDNGTIESKEIYRLIHAICLLSQNEQLSSSKGAVNQ